MRRWQQQAERGEREPPQRLMLPNAARKSAAQALYPNHPTSWRTVTVARREPLKAKPTLSEILYPNLVKR